MEMLSDLQTGHLRRARREGSRANTRLTARKMSRNKKAEGKAAASLALVMPAGLLCLLLPCEEEEKVWKDCKDVRSKGRQN